MDNSTATENCFLDQNCDDFNIDEFSNIYSSLLMSLLEDSQVEDGDDEMLRRIIPSFEPETTNHSETYNSGSSSKDYIFSDVDQLGSCSTSPDRFVDFEWIDMEMAHSYPNYDMTSHYIGHFTEKVQTMVELGIMFEDYSQVCCGMPMEEEDYIGLWQ